MVEFIEVKGSHKEMGIQQGEGFPIKDMLNSVLHSQMFSEVKPKLVPTFVVKIVLGLMGRFKVKKALKEYLPNQHERMKGIAEGAGIGKNITYGIQYIEVYTGDPKTLISIPPAACTKLFALPPATADGSVMYARNYDFPEVLSPYQMVRKSIPDDGYKNLAMSQYPLVGTHMGINEKGLVCGINYARTWEKYPDDFSFQGAPPTAIVQEILETCKDTDEAVEFITNFPARSDAQHYGLLDKSGNACVVETTHTDYAIRRPEDGIMAHTNTFRTDKFWDHNPPHDRHWKMPSMRDKAWRKSPMMRYDRALELLQKHKGNIT
jgi:predicted choloylglycine hydrolase